MDIERARYYVELYEMVNSQLPFVEMMVYFKLFEDTPLAQWGSANEITFDVFQEPQNGLSQGQGVRYASGLRRQRRPAALNVITT